MADLCCCLLFFFFRAGSLLSPKVQTSNGSFRHPTPHKRPLLSSLQKPNACVSPLTNGHTADPKSPKSSSDLSSQKEEADLSTAALQFHQNKKRKKKKRKKRRNTEEQDSAEPVGPAAAEAQVDSGHDHTRKKRKKKRKREAAEESVKERGCVPSHLDTSNHEEDWCHGGIWRLTSRSDTEEPEPKPQPAATAERSERLKESEKAKKRKKKKKRTEALLDTSASSVAETWVHTLLSIFLHFLQIILHFFFFL